MSIKVLNLYAGIGGNRKLWQDVEVTAVEINPEIAKIYKDFFPEDNVVVGDAHQYLLEHFTEFEFIWSSPPCPSHSRFRKGLSYGTGAKPIYPDMKLYEEILFLKHYFKGKWVVENVVPYYTPLIEAVLIQRHLFWSNFLIPYEYFKKDKLDLMGNKEKNLKIIKDLEKHHDFNLDKYDKMSIYQKSYVLKNCVSPKLSAYIFEWAFKNKQKKLI